MTIGLAYRPVRPPVAYFYFESGLIWKRRVHAAFRTQGSLWSHGPGRDRPWEDIMSRKFLIPLLAAVFLAAPAFAPAPFSGLSDSVVAATTDKGSKSKVKHRYRPAPKSHRSTTVKSSKSNTSDRMGGGGGGKGGTQLNPQPEPPGVKKR